jgi:peptide/nickel transport system permease protein
VSPPRRRTRVGSVSYALHRLSELRLARWGALVLALLSLVAILAELVASDYPLLCSVDGVVYVLPAVTHPRSLTGRDNARLAEQSVERPGSVFALYPLVRHGPTSESPSRLAPPSAEHPFGTDSRGRDVFAQTIHGVRTQLGFALLTVCAYVALGAFIGATAGYFGGTIDFFTERVTDTMSAIPSFVLILCVQAALPHPDLETLFVTVVAARFAEVARLVRVEVVDVSTRDYVLAARALGASPLRVLLRHVLPNARGQAIVSATFGLGAVVLLEAQLDFLRVGDRGRFASWGQVMSDVRDRPDAYWLLLFPGLFLLATVVATNLVGEGLRDALDPRAQRKRP